VAVAYLGLGGNLGEVVTSMQQALHLLSLHDTITVTGVSRVYKTRPVGGSPDQPSYLNLVIAIETSSLPRDLLGICLSIEQLLGRVRVERWGPRTIDINILLYGERVIAEDGLVVPHRMLRKRLFALRPLADVAPPDLALPPDGRKLCELIDAAYEDPEFASQLPMHVIKTGIEFRRA